MILGQIRDFLKQYQNVPLKELSEHFKMSQGAMKGTLEYWIKKGKVEKLPQNTICSGGCTQCPPDSIEIYRWKSNTQESPVSFNL